MKIGRQRRVERNAFELADFGTQIVDLSLDPLAGLLDLLLPGEEEQDVACGRKGRWVYDVAKCKRVNPSILNFFWSIFFRLFSRDEATLY